MMAAPAPAEPRVNRRAHGSQEEPDREALRRLWTLLLVRLKHVETTCRQPAALRQLRCVGVRRMNVLVANLGSEYLKSSEMASRNGCAPRPADLLAQTELLSLRDDLQLSFETLGHCYQEVLLAWQPPPGTHRHNWLDSRARVHLARAEALRRAA
jgi:hypothetical protein